jgi:excinuclease ABC subunit B
VVGEAAVALRPEQIVRRIKQLEAEMFRHARNLEFEQAARLRDEIEHLKRVELGLPEQKAG